MMISVPKFFWNSNTWTFLVYHLLFPGLQLTLDVREAVLTKFTAGTVLGSKRQDRFWDPFLKLVQKISGSFFRTCFITVTRTSGPWYPPQFDGKKISQGGVSLLGGSQIKNPEEEEPPFKLLKSINFGVFLQGGGSFSGFLVWKPPNRFIPPEGGVSYNQIPTISCE